jgi:carbohydrate diacid regulator
MEHIHHKDPVRLQEGRKKMISNQILQNTIEGLKAIARVELCIMDIDGKEVAATVSMYECEKPAMEFAQSPADSQEIQGYQYFKIYDEQQLEYILIAGGSGEDVYMVGKMVAFQIQNLLVAYKERFDKDNFIKNLLLDNLLLVDIYSRAKKLHIQADVRRVVMIVETDSTKDCNVLEVVRSGNTNSRDFITAVDENNVIVVRDLSEGDSPAEIDRGATGLESFLVKEGMKNVRVAYGTVVKEIKDVSRSYKEARMALDVGKIFFSDRNVVAYSELGIGRLIYQLPIPLCRMFIREIFGGKSPDDFDEETLTTINKFFENSLNVSETSRQLFIHRNTLVYRLDKLQKATGLDLRVFEDAITFKIALMVVKYMKYMETFDY